MLSLINSDLLSQYADVAQQAFLSDNTPTLQAALPALEALHTAWSGHIMHGKYGPFWAGWVVAVEKIDDDYQKTASSHAYTFAMSM